MDSKQKEEIGVAIVVTALMKAGILVTKPYFDKEGADLIGFTSVGDNGRFCRIQSKYRELKKRTSVVIDSDYVTGAFVLFLYLQTSDDTHLFCFLPNDITNHFSSGHQKSAPVFRLSLTQKSLQSLINDASLQFSATKVAELFTLMRASSPEAAMGRAFASLIKDARRLEKVRTKRDRLQQLLHSITVKTLKKEAAEQSIEILKEFMAYIETEQQPV